MDSLNFNSVETLPNQSARAAFQVNSSAVFKEDVDIVPVIIDDTLSYMPWGGDNNMPFDILKLIEDDETLSTRRVAPGTTLSLFLYAESGESLEYSVQHTFQTKKSEARFIHSYFMDSGKTAATSGVVQINVPLSSVIADAAGFAAVRPDNITLLSFTVRCGKRSVTCFVDNSRTDLDSFFFRNCFNVWDSATLPVTTTAKTDVDRSLAIINGISRFYNQSTAKTYEVEAGPLTSDEAEWIDQLFSSHDVFRIEPDPTNSYDPLVLAPILITDATCEIQDGDEKLNTVKFTWRHTDNRPIVRLSASPGIFTSPYNIVYS